MAYGFNEDRSKVEVYTQAEIDAMDLADDQALVQEAAARQAGDNALDARVSNILDNQDLDPNKDSELVDIRTGYDGFIHETAGDAVRYDGDRLYRIVNGIIESNISNASFSYGYLPNNSWDTVANTRNRAYYKLPKIISPIHVIVDDTYIYQHNLAVSLYRKKANENSEIVTLNLRDVWLYPDEYDYQLVIRLTGVVDDNIDESIVKSFNQYVKIDAAYGSINRLFNNIGITPINVSRGGFDITDITHDVNNSEYITSRCRSNVISLTEPMIFCLNNPNYLMTIRANNDTKLIEYSSYAEIDFVGDIRISFFKPNLDTISYDEFVDLCNSVYYYRKNDKYTLFNNGNLVNKYNDMFGSRLLGIFKTFTAIGDSLTCGYTSKGGTTHNSAEAKAAGNNWPTYLGIDLGRPTVNIGVGGSTTHDWRYSHIQTADIDTGCYFIGLGVNDIRQHLSIGSANDIVSDKSNNADSFYGNLDYVIRSCLEYNPNCHIFVFTVPPTELNAPSYNVAIREICDLYSRVHCIDLAKDYDSVYTETFLSKVWDGHSTPMGYMYMSQIIKYAISKYMIKNYSEFNSIPYE